MKRSTIRLRELNKHINFDREGKKGNSRKWATKVTCVKCKKQFTLAFKPRNPEVYCDECFKKKDRIKFQSKGKKEIKQYKKTTSKTAKPKTRKGLNKRKEKKKLYDTNKNEKNKKS